jgi:hypothetical protein
MFTSADAIEPPRYCMKRKPRNGLRPLVRVLQVLHQAVASSFTSPLAHRDGFDGRLSSPMCQLPATARAFDVMKAASVRTRIHSKPANPCG